MFEAYTKIALAVDACKGHVEGRKKLQKMIYIAKVLGYPLREDYTLYLYGPYSEELAGELQRMKELDLLDERKLDSSYSIKITKNGKDLLNYFQTNIEKEMGIEKLNKMRTLFKELGYFDPWQLEILATLFYFYQIGYSDFNELQRIVRKVKPKFSPKQISTMTEKVRMFIEKFAVQQ
ncbi:MAG: hypothetical protein HXS48_14105 [Theionarchaea archaeon]|nr:MAG: hypothetical protein AYK19_03165 [Theionarchaea archaeon DG-70-1]MBU7028064.1 hypothetical protein [Theionarchaea archaeon]